ncbi:hypothetical protein GCM10009733_006920 [Nonomuraea maheshkhaliensis]|uniref:HTH cro/C1-type domain-containing protein n=1 Tax=Nonomuraea maheshkhaliensis TaxID=419590 RepID=A0ABP4QK02_9ACTN
MAVSSISAIDRGLGTCLQHLREGKGITLKVAAAHLMLSTASIRRLENGQTLPRLADLRALIDLYGIGGVRSAALQDVARRERAQRRSPTATATGARDHGEAVLACLEQGATTISAYQGFMLPALVRTRAYMRAIYAARQMTDGLEDALSLHERRVAAIHGHRRLTIVVEESALRRHVGGPVVMREQHAHLAEMAALPHITVQVIAADANVLPRQAAFTLLRFAEAAARWAGEFARLQAAALSCEDSMTLIAAAQASAAAPGSRSSRSASRKERLT